jgi:hypothetical protein
MSKSEWIELNNFDAKGTSFVKISTITSVNVKDQHHCALVLVTAGGQEYDYDRADTVALAREKAKWLVDQISNKD